MTARQSVDIIIATHDDAAHLAEAIDSVLEQGYPGCGLIVVDDGSTDDTPELLDGYAGRLRAIRQSNQGVAAARNRGIEASEADLIGFLDADDALEPGAIEAMVARLEADPTVDLLAGGYLEMDAAGRPLRTIRPWLGVPDLAFERWLLSCPLIIGTALVRRSVLGSLRFDPALERCEDWDFYMQLAKAGCRMAWLHRTVCRYRVYDGTRAGDARAMHDSALVVLDKAAEPTPKGRRASPGQLRHARAVAHLIGASRAYGTGLTAEAARWIEEAAALQPELLAGDWPEALDWMGGWAYNGWVEDPIDYYDTMLAHLPAVARALGRHGRALKARALVERGVATLAVGDGAAAQRWFGRLAEVEPRWREQASDLTAMVVDALRAQPPDEGEALLPTVVDRLSRALPAFRSESRRARGWYHALRAIELHARRQRASVRRHLRACLQADPRWLSNRGVLAIIAEQLLGRHLTSALRAAMAIPSLPVRRDLSAGASILASLRAGGLVFLSRGSRILPGPERIDFDAPSSRLLLGLSDRSPAGGALIEVEAGGRFQIAGELRVGQGSYLRVEPDGWLRFEAGAFVNHDVRMKCQHHIRIGAGSVIAWDVDLLDTDHHVIETVDGGASSARPPGIELGAQVWVGCGSTILKGVRVGDGAVVGAGSVVTRDVPAGALVAGNPARVVKERVAWR